MKPPHGYTLKQKALVYITHGHSLLVFDHVDFPDAGTQVPGGTVNSGESPEIAAMREAEEETGLKNLEMRGLLGEAYQKDPGRKQLHHRFFYHIQCTDKNPPQKWQHYERKNSDNPTEPILFELYWLDLTKPLPKLATGHDAMIDELLKHFKIKAGSHNV